MNWLESQMYELYSAMGGETYEGGTSAHLSTVTASHEWNMRYGRGDLTDEQFTEYYEFSQGTANELIASGQNESEQGVTRYWMLMEEYLAPISERTAEAAGAGVEAAQALEGNPAGSTGQFPWWILGVGAALFLFVRK